MKWFALVLATLILIPGCTQKKEQTVNAPPAPTYSGPSILHGTIGSVVQVRGNDEQVVQGIGLVVGLNGTGSAEVPPRYRELMLNEIRRGGFGETRLGLGDISPVEVLNSDTTAVVAIWGVVPPGAPRGTRFDLRVNALASTTTRSLADGTLYSTRLQAGDTDPTVTGYVLGDGKGPVFVNPFIDPETPAEDFDDPRRVGLILAGGITRDDRSLELVLNRPSLAMVQQIDNRIRQRFDPITRGEPSVSNPRNDRVIEIRIPTAFKDDPQRLLQLVGHIYLNPDSRVMRDKAHELATLLRDPANHPFADDIALAWEAMGKLILPAMRDYYNHDDPIVRMAALTAGARLNDTRTIEVLKPLALSDQGKVSEQATVLIGELLKQQPNSLPLIAIMREILDHNDPLVRVASYEALAAVDDASIKPFGFSNKMLMALVEPNRPLIYVNRSNLPRIIIFNNNLGFNEDMLFSMWNNRLMIKRERGEDQIDIFYQQPTAGRPMTAQIPANLGYLTGVLAYSKRDNPFSKSPGLDFSYSRVVSILHKLTQEGYVSAPMIVQADSVEQRFERRRIGDTPIDRPDSEPGENRGVNRNSAIAPLTDSGDNQ